VDVETVLLFSSLSFTSEREKEGNHGPGNNLFIKKEGILPELPWSVLPFLSFYLQ